MSELVRAQMYAVAMSYLEYSVDRRDEVRRATVDLESFSGKQIEIRARRSPDVIAYARREGDQVRLVFEDGSSFMTPINGRALRVWCPALDCRKAMADVLDTDYELILQAPRRERLPETSGGAVRWQTVPGSLYEIADDQDDPDPIELTCGRHTTIVDSQKIRAAVVARQKRYTPTGPYSVISSVRALSEHID